MEDLDVLILWRIGKERDRRVPQGQYRYVKDVVALNRNWTINVRSLSPMPNSLVLKGSSSKRLQVSGNIKILHRNFSEGTRATSKKFVRILEAKQEELLLPITKKPDQYFHRMDSSSLEIHGYLNISEIPSVSVKYKPTEKFQSKSLTQLSNDLRSLLKEQNSAFTDVQLKCKDVVFSAHKNILSARSPVFAAMFRKEIKGPDATISVLNMDPSNFQILLNFMYSGKAVDLTHSVIEQLLFAAHAYQLKDLKEICIDYLKSNISLESVLSVLLLGNLYDRNLKSHALVFIGKHSAFPELKDGEQWKCLQRKKPELVMEVLNYLVNYLYDNQK